MLITERRLRKIIRQVLSEITALDSIGSGKRITDVTRENISEKVKNYIVEKTGKLISNENIKNFPSSKDICSTAQQYVHGSPESHDMHHNDSFTIEITQRSSINGEDVDPDGEGNLCFYVRMIDDGVARSILNHFYIKCEPDYINPDTGMHYDKWDCTVWSDSETVKHQEDSVHGYGRKGRGSRRLDRHEKLARFN